jgi:hypothetical protein
VRRPAALLALVLALGGCGGGGGGGGDDLTVERADGTAIDFSGPLRAWCDADDRVWIIKGDAPTDDDENPPAYWTVTAPLEKARSGEAIRVGDRTDVYDGDAGMFVLDAEQRNELSSQEEDASGTVEFEEVSCARGATVRVSVDVQLGSEFGEQSGATARGAAEAEIGDPVDFPDP